MRLSLSILLLFAALLSGALPARGYALQYADSAGVAQMRWASNAVTIALSSSLTSPPSNVKAGSDVVGAVQRALRHWEEAANVSFIVVNSDLQSISASGSGGDGVNLITIANTSDNSAFFPQGAEVPGRTRVFRQGSTITEADIALNPNLPFSTDGTPNTYDLEAAITHEVGHLLGLEHSGVVGATMQPRFARNGYNGAISDFPIMTARTLSDDDKAGARAIYGTPDGFGSIAGTVQVAGVPGYGAHVWAQETATGRVRGGGIALQSGAFRIDGLPPGQYKLVVEPLDEPIAERDIPSSSGAYAGLQQQPPPFPFQTYDAPSSFDVAANSMTNAFLFATSGAPTLNPSFVGTNGALSTVAVPVFPGSRTNILVGGANLTPNLLDAKGISTGSPFVTIDPASVSFMQFGAVPVISFDVTASSIAPPGEYSIRFASNTGEIAYLCGALTVDPPFGVSSGNLITHDQQFFVAQHYRDFLNREPDSSGLQFWTNQIASCNGDTTCIDIKRQNVSAAYFLSTEFQETGFYVIRIQRAAFGRRSNDAASRVIYQSFLRDAQTVSNGVVVGQTGADQLLDKNKTAYALSIVNSSAFASKYPSSLSAGQFVDALFQTAGVTPSASERQTAIAAFGAGDAAGRAAALRSVAEANSLRTAEFNSAFVLLQYFGYLRRNPTASPDNNDSGYQFWLKKLNDAGGNYIQAEMIRSFIVSDEYRQRFGKI